MTTSDNTGPWIARLTVGIALILTLVLAGPRAYAALAARLGGGERQAVLVDPARVSLTDVPEWLRGPVLERVLRDLEPALQGRFIHGDRVAAAAAVDRLRAVAWVASAEVRELPPDRYRVALALRRPVLQAVVETAPSAADRRAGVVALLDAEGVVLPVPRRPQQDALPCVLLPPAVAELLAAPGGRCAAPAVLAALAVALEWRNAIERAVPAAPPLRAVDAANLGGGYLQDPRYSEVLVGLGASDGRIVWMHYGRAESDGGPVSVKVRAEILAAILEEHPGLEGLAAGDLRLRNRWRDGLVAVPVVEPSVPR